MWILYAFAASLCWGISYAASGPILKKGLSPLVFFFGYSLLGLVGATVALAVSGQLFPALRLEAVGREDRGLFLFSIVGSAVGAYLTYAAMSAKNPTLVSLIEISYPLFVIIFTWILFREFQLNTATLFGAVLILAGVAILVLGERGSG
jgi:drug/metabolite transporter (DMT)-like permease